ncbi:hypothetical protein [Nocardia rhizosphaerae]|uniref:Uncharacterized protein n=1 Tax=Nocardia rhizosphaerae TaxID=1691571 RepID=A0ABV8KY03_9NOCA
MAAQPVRGAREAAYRRAVTEGNVAFGQPNGLPWPHHGAWSYRMRP